MNDDITSALIGFGGALVGAMVSMATTYLAAWYTRKIEKERAEEARRAGLRMAARLLRFELIELKVKLNTAIDGDYTGLSDIFKIAHWPAVHTAVAEMSDGEASALANIYGRLRMMQIVGPADNDSQSHNKMRNFYYKTNDEIARALHVLAKYTKDDEEPKTS